MVRDSNDTPAGDDAAPRSLTEVERLELSDLWGEECLQLLFTAQQELREPSLQATVEGVEARRAMQDALGCLVSAIEIARRLVTTAREAHLEITGRPAPTADKDRDAPGGFQPVWFDDAAWFIVRDDATIVAASDDGCELLGRPRHELVGRDLADATGLDAARTRRRIGLSAAAGITSTQTTLHLIGGPQDVTATVSRLPGRIAEEAGHFVLLTPTADGSDASAARAGA